MLRCSAWKKRCTFSWRKKASKYVLPNSFIMIAYHGTAIAAKTASPTAAGGKRRGSGCSRASHRATAANAGINSPSGPLVRTARPLNAHANTNHASRRRSERLASQSENTAPQTKVANTMSVKIIRADTKYSAPVASTMADRSPARGLNIRAPNAQVMNTSKVAKTAAGARTPSSLSPNIRKEPMESQ